MNIIFSDNKQKYLCVTFFCWSILTSTDHNMHFIFINFSCVSWGSGIFFFKSKKKSFLLREDTHKKSVSLVVGPLRFYPPYANGLVVHAPFFSFFLTIAWNGFWQKKFSNFLAKRVGYIGKKSVFLLCCRGVRPLKKKIFLCVSFP